MINYLLSVEGYSVNYPIATREIQGKLLQCIVNIEIVGKLLKCIVGIEIVGKLSCTILLRLKLMR